MAGVNKVILIGNLGKDPEMRYTASGMTVTNFSLATSRQWKSEDGSQHDETEWHNVVLFGRQAEVANQYLSKGKKVYIEGRIQTRSWDDQNSGEKKYRTEIVGQAMQFLDSRGEGGGSSGGYGGAPVPDNDEGLDEIPF